MQTLTVCIKDRKEEIIRCLYDIPTFPRDKAIDEKRYNPIRTKAEIARMLNELDMIEDLIDAIRVVKREDPQLGKTVCSFALNPAYDWYKEYHKDRAKGMSLLDDINEIHETGIVPAWIDGKLGKDRRVTGKILKQLLGKKQTPKKTLYEDLLNKVCVGLKSSGQKFSSKLIGISDGKLTFKSINGGIYINDIQDIVMLKPRQSRDQGQTTEEASRIWYGHNL